MGRRTARGLAVSALAALALTVTACGAPADGTRPVAVPGGARGPAASASAGSAGAGGAPAAPAVPGAVSHLPPDVTPAPSAAGPPGPDPSATRVPAPPPSVPAPSSSAPGRVSVRPSAPPAGPAAEAPPAFGVPVRAGDATQVITVRAQGTYAVVTAWQKDDGRWRVVRAATGRVGENGVTDGASRRQGTGTTPSGTYTLTEAFGIKADPGTRLPYTRVGADHWWVQDPRSPYYNQMRLGSRGGFDTTSPENAATGSERLAAHVPAYHYAIVVDFNRAPAVPGRGAGIFLHVNGRGATAGCVSVPEADMVWLLRWIDPDRHPVIAIA